MTDIEIVRLKISDKSVITRETATGNAVDKHFKLENAPVVLLPAPEVRVDNVLLVEGVDYTVNYTQGVISLTAIPALDADIEFTYYWSIFTDDEIQVFLDEAGGSTVIASSSALLAWAASAAKLAKRQTLSGGGGLGQVVVDTSVAAKELRATAKALVDAEVEIAGNTPAEGLTEIPWTEAMYKRQLGQRFIRRPD